jgi:uncharacterized protein YndB with AHSA1/START domain
MDSAAAFPAEFKLHIHQEIEIAAPADVVFGSILDQAGPGMADMEGKSLNCKLEAWPGGRWYRDLGNNTGHWWGTVQVIKPPTLLEIAGPMFMSYPVASHIQYRITEKKGGCTLSLTHRAFGELAKEHREGVVKGWGEILARIKGKSER